MRQKKNKKTLNIVLVRMDRNATNSINDPRHLHPALDLCYVKAALDLINDVQCDMIDLWGEIFSQTKLLAKLDRKKIDIVVIKGASFCLEESLSFGKALRTKNILVFGVGQQVEHFNLYNKTDWKESFDICIKGECEVIVPQIIERLISLESFDSIVSETDLRIKRNEPYFVEDPSSLPVIKHTAKNLARYVFPFPLRGKKISKWGYVLTAWGCPYSCSHCTMIVRKSAGQKLRLRNPVKVVDEIEHLLNLGADGICFEDDTITVNKSHFKNICQEIMNRNLKFSWMAHARPDEISEDIMPFAEKSGAKLFKIGVESGNKKIIELLGKSNHGSKWIDQSINAFSILEKYDIGHVALFMIGTPTEKYENIEESIELAKKIKPDYLQVQIFTAYPDTKIYKENINVKSVTLKNLYHYSMPTKSLSSIEPSELKKIQNKFYREYYISTRYISRHFFNFWRYYISPSYVIYLVGKLKGKLIEMLT